MKLNVGLLWPQLRSTGRGLFCWHIVLGIEGESGEVIHWERSVMWCWDWDGAGSRSETAGA